MVDIDNFKAYNDAFGHLRGDACLHAVAEALAQTAATAGQYVARYGGEEFVIVLPGSALEDATALAEQARHAVIGIGLTAPGPGGRVTVSAGCACSEGREPSNASELLGAADAALYAAKRAGRNRVEPVAVIDRD
jgi:diguanylate cyclase (GGDEF)-like protein